MKIKTYPFFLLTLLICLNTFGQEVKDTVYIKDITVSHAHIEYFNDGAKKETIDSSALLLLPSSSLGDVLLSTTPALLKSYGHSGAATTISLRGGGSNRTQVMWEGFPINSITMGETDLSLIPSSCFNTVSIDHSASGANYGGGTFGGAIQLSNTPLWKPHNDITFFSSVGSFETYNTHAKYSIGNKKFETGSTIFWGKSKGNFEYYDNVIRDTCLRKNADYYKYGLIQNAQFKLSKKTILSVGFWYSIKNNNLPPIMGTKQLSPETQTDSLLYSFIILKQHVRKGIFIAKSGYFYKYQLYTKKNSISDTLYTEYSEIIHHNSLNSLQYKFYFTSKITGQVEYEYNLLQADVSNYLKSRVTEGHHHFVAGIRYKTNCLSANIGARKEYTSNNEIPVVFSGGINYTLKNSPVTLRFTAGKKYRTPTFNDLYWYKWGNPNLIPEYGYSEEIGIQYKIFHKNSQFVFDIGAYNASINDMIMWVPRDSVWNPFNVAKAQLQGFEIRMQHVYKTTHLTLKNKLGADINFSHIVKMYNKSDQIAEGNQLYNVPKYSLNYFSNISIDNWNFGILANFLSERIFEINKEPLPAFCTIDAFFKLHAQTKQATVIYSLSIKNFTNTNYELIRSYPMPGRYYEFGIQLIFNNK